MGIEFNLQSNPDTDGVYCFDGWEDYFDPLIKTVKSSAIACRLNANVNSPLKQSLLPIRRKALKLLHPDFSYFTFDFNEIACRFACQACSSPINVRAEIRKHFNKIYSLNSSVTSRVQERKRSLEVSSPYCVFHIRRGDKIIEADYVEIQKYISRYKALFPKLDVPIYLMTDSVSVVDTCLARLPSILYLAIPFCLFSRLDMIRQRLIPCRKLIVIKILLRSLLTSRLLEEVSFLWNTYE